MGQAIIEFRRRLDRFIFFHLGSDARLKWDDPSEESEQDAVVLHLEHPRIHSFSQVLSSRQVAEMASDAEAFEEFMLDLLVRYRRGGFS